MIWYAVKVLVSAVIIVVISEVSKKLPLLGSPVASLPLVSVLGMIWIYGETRDAEKLAAHAFGTFGTFCPPCRCFWSCPGCFGRVLAFLFPWLRVLLLRPSFTCL